MMREAALDDKRGRMYILNENQQVASLAGECLGVGGVWNRLRPKRSSLEEKVMKISNLELSLYTVESTWCRCSTGDLNFGDFSEL